MNRTNPEFCTFEGCDRKAVARTLCDSHAQQFRKHGRLKPLNRRDVSSEERFWAKVDKSGGPDACWPWLGAPSFDGYGVFQVGNSSMVKAHRYAYELIVGPIPDGYVIDHECHDPTVCALGRKCPHRMCVNPTHMAAVTALTNGSPERCRAPRLDIECCPEGHPYAGRNLLEYTRGRSGRPFRQCLTCRSTVHMHGDRLAARLAWIAGADNGAEPRPRPRRR